MKRRTLRSIACAAIMALALSATACGSKDAAKTEDNAAVEDEASAEDIAEPEAEDVAEPETEDATEPETENTEDNTADSSTEGYSTLEDCCSDPSVKSELDSLVAGMAQEGMSISYEVKENTFTMIFRFEDSSVIVDGIGDALDAAVETQADAFKTQAAAFDDVIGQPGACTVVVRYTDPDDNVLSENEFKAQ